VKFNEMTKKHLLKKEPGGRKAKGACLLQKGPSPKKDFLKTDKSEFGEGVKGKGTTVGAVRAIQNLTTKIFERRGKVQDGLQKTGGKKMPSGKKRQDQQRGGQKECRKTKPSTETNNYHLQTQSGRGLKSGPRNPDEKKVQDR